MVGKDFGSCFDGKVIDCSFPAKLRRIGDPKTYSVDDWPYKDEKSLVKTDSSCPFGNALYCNKSYIYASVTRKEFDKTPLDLHGKSPFTLIAWCKFVGKRHLVAGIWDEDGWARYEGRRQIALFGGMFQQKGIVAHISATGAASHPQSIHHQRNHRRKNCCPTPSETRVSRIASSRHRRCQCPNIPRDAAGLDPGVSTSSP